MDRVFPDWAVLLGERKMMMRVKNTKYYSLCVKAISGEITLEEKNDLNRWLQCSQDNQRLFESFERIWEHAKPAQISSMPDAVEEWFKLEQSLDLGSSKIERKSGASVIQNAIGRFSGLLETRTRPAAFAFAAVIVLVIGVLLLKDPLFGPRLREVISPPKQRREVSLADGSLIRMNCGSSIKFPKTFSDDVREVFLEGEAFFEVAHDGRPFIVLTRNAKTTVLGTEFNVRSRDEETRVIVKEGRVKLCPIDESGSEVILSRGQMSQITGRVPPQPPEPVNVDHLLGWLEGRIVFEKAPLGEIIFELERVYDVRIGLENPEFGQQTVTASFEDATLETVLSSICLTLGIQYRADGQDYVVFVE
ncbi:MAG: FecR domain-containing protein [bacterium]